MQVLLYDAVNKVKKGKQTIGRGRRGWSTKIHLALSPQGLVNFVVLNM